MARKRTQSPEFFEENAIDPLTAATGSMRPGRSHPVDPAAGGAKQKAGFYLSRRVLERFNRKFYELKLEGKAVGNKSTLLEAAIDYALDDIDQGTGSTILARFDRSPIR